MTSNEQRSSSDSSPGSGAAGERPNIVLFMSDQHRGDIMGCAGDNVVKTPHLDRLAAEGIRYDSVFCQGPLCMPARASFLTERYVRDHGVLQNQPDTPTNLPTFLHSLQARGYHTCCIGKMHLWVHGGTRDDGRRTHDTRERIDQMRAYGFDEPIETVGKLASVAIKSEYSDHLEARGLYGTYQEWVAARMYAGAGGTTPAGRPHWALSSAASNPVSGADYIDAWHGQRVARWVEEYDRAEPFFLWVGFPGPHDPWDAPGDFVDLYRNVPMPMPGSLRRPDLPETGPFRSFLNYFLNTHSDSPNLTDEAIEKIRRYYYANVTVIDQAIGSILAALERRGLLENTWVIYTSDHGEMMGEHRMLTKMVFYEPSVRVPLLIRPPAGSKTQVVTDLVEHFDVSATIRTLAGAGADTGEAAFEGRPLLDPNGGLHDLTRVAVHSENFGLGMVRTTTHKLVFWEDTQEVVQLFDLVADPFEDDNLVGTSAAVEVLGELQQHLVAPFLAMPAAGARPEFLAEAAR
jgi:arylsulfatase